MILRYQNVSDGRKRDKFLPLAEVQEIAGRKSRSTVWRWVKAGTFPAPHRIGPNSIAWLESEIVEWLDAIKR